MSGQLLAWLVSKECRLVYIVIDIIQICCKVLALHESVHIVKCS